MKDMMAVYQEINKLRQNENKVASSLTMFSETWCYQQHKIDKVLEMIKDRTGGDIKGAEYDTLVYLLSDIVEELT